MGHSSGSLEDKNIDSNANSGNPINEVSERNKTMSGIRLAAIYVIF